MNRRKFLFIALAIGLPLALIVPLRAARSWQPRVLQLPRNTNAAAAVYTSDTNALFWSPQGLLLSRSFSDAWDQPRSMSNWNGATISVRALRAQNAALDASGQWAALIYATQHYTTKTTEEFDIWNVPDERNRFDAAQRINAARAQPSQQLGFPALALSPDSKIVAFNQYKPDRIAAVGIADAQSGQIVARVAHRGVLVPLRHPMKNAQESAQYFEVTALAFSPDNRQLAVVGINLVRIVDAQSGRVVRSWKKPFAIARCAVWSPDGRHLALARGAKNWWANHASNPAAPTPFLWIHDVQDGNVLRSWARNPGKSPSAGVTNLSWVPDGQTLAWGTYDGQTLLMNLKLGALEKRFSMDNSSATDPAQFVAFAPDGRTLAVASENKITLWRVG